MLLDQQLTDEERMVRDTARAFCQEQLAPRVLDAFRHERTDPAIYKEMAALHTKAKTKLHNIVNRVEAEAFKAGYYLATPVFAVADLVFGVPVRVALDPLTAVVRGAGVVTEDPAP